MKPVLLKINECSVQFDFNGDKERERELLPFCLEVLKHFELPSERIYVYISATDLDDFTEKRPYNFHYKGKYFRGLYAPHEAFHRLPDSIKSYVFRPIEEIMRIDVSTFKERCAVDHFIYIKKSTSDDVTGFVATLSHEMRHLIQYCVFYKIWSANALIYDNLAWKIDPGTNLTPIDIPHEQDANIFSKHVAEKVCGVESVRNYADSQLKRFTEMLDLGDLEVTSEHKKWEFFRNIDSTSQYNLQVKTIALFEKYRAKIIEKDLGGQYGIDATKEVWWQS